MNIHHLPAYLREYLFPAGCAVCGEPLLDAADAWYGLCGDCRAALAPDPEEERCETCGRPLISERERCLGCREAGTRAFDRGFSVFPYGGPWRRLLTAYKFGKNRALANFLAETMLKLAPAELPWVPVPPRPGKIRKTGWDQVACLAGRLKAAGAALEPCLRRLSSESQKRLSGEERKTNLKGRIQCLGKPPEECILFDDVITTGATFDACTEALKQAGTRKVLAFSLFFD
jgi:ComF family protein